MEMWNKLMIILVLAQIIFGATTEEHLVTTSFEFLDKYTQKQYRNIISLTISNSSINKVDPKLKYLKNLKYLDLSHNNVHIASMPTLNKLKVLKLNANNLKSINMSLLPHNIEDLDLSNNLLQHIPRDWRILKSLKVLHLHKNPIDCECNNVLNYDRLVKSEISVPEAIHCHSPKKYLGKEITAVNCSIDDIMLDDDADVGSGSVDIFEDSLGEARSISLFEEEEDPKGNITIIDDFIEVNSTTTESSGKEEEIIDEGSGDEGSGYIYHGFDSGVLGCVENCSTPGPIGGHDEEYASPPPSPFEQFKMFVDDMNPFKTFDDVSSSTTTSTTSATTTATTTTTTEQPSTKTNDDDKLLANEPSILKESNNKLETGRTSDKDIETQSNNNTIGELERASSIPQNSNAVYAIAAIFSFLAILFVICFIKKRRNNQRKRNRRDKANTPAEEMKPLSKLSVQTINEKPTKTAQNIPENIPLINGQNGAPKNASPVLKAYTPLAHPEKIEPEEESVQLNGQMVPEPDEVEFRPHEPELLTPQRERVTIRESEIPESIPKTPLLVHRQKNSDGEIITTIVP